MPPRSRRRGSPRRPCPGSGKIRRTPHWREGADHRDRAHPVAAGDEVGAGDARVGGGRGELRAGCRGAPLQLEREEQVGQLGAAVGDVGVVALRRVALEHLAVAGVVGDRRHRRDPGRRCLEQVRHQQPGEGEVAEVVGAELQLEAVVGLASPRRGHHAGVVDEEVEGALEPLGQGVHRLLRGQVELLDPRPCRVAPAARIRGRRPHRHPCCAPRARRRRRAGRARAPRRGRCRSSRR